METDSTSQQALCDVLRSLNKRFAVRPQPSQIYNKTPGLFS